MARRKHDFDPEEFDLNAEMETGFIIGDGRGGGYDVALEQKYLRHFSDFDDALRFVEEEMKRRQYWPNVFRVNERGNVNLLVLKPKWIKDRLIKVDYEIVHGWV